MPRDLSLVYYTSDPNASVQSTPRKMQHQQVMTSEPRDGSHSPLDDHLLSLQQKRQSRSKRNSYRDSGCSQRHMPYVMSSRVEYVNVIFLVLIGIIGIVPFASAQQQGAAEESTLLNDFLLVADGAAGALYQMRLDGSHLKSLQVTSRLPSEVAFDPIQNHVYWSDMQARLIKRVGLKSGSQEEIVEEFSEDSLPEGLSVDPKAKLLFFADAGRGLIYQRTLSSKQRRTLVINTVKPRSLQVDPQHRYLYWSDWGKETIERISYDGSGRQTYIAFNNSRVNGITLDIAERQIYWADAHDNTIKKASIGSTQPTPGNWTSNPQISTVFTFNANTLPNKTTANFYGITVDDNYIYLTDWYDSAVLRVRKDGEGFQRLGNTTLQTLNGIVVYKKTHYTLGKDSECSNENAGCSHLCIPVDSGAVCACPDVWILGGDNKTCLETAESKGPDLIWLEYDGFFTGYVRGIRGEPSDYLATREVRTWSIRSPAWYWTAVDVDYEANQLYLVDKFDKFIVTMTMSGDKEINVIYYGTSSEVNGVAVDWVNKNVYWTDSLYNWIMIAKAEEKTNHTRRLIRTGLDKPHGIAVYPQKGMIYWSDWGLTPRIEMATLAGENRRVFIDTDLSEPRGLTIDYATDRLFWANLQSIESISLDGSDRRTYQAFSGSYFMDLAVHQNFIFATDLGPPTSSSLIWFYDTEAQENGIKLGLARKPFGVAMAHPDRQEQITSPCATYRCDQLCVGTPTGEAQCLCQDGYLLSGDGRSCKKDPDHTGPTYVYSMGDRICSVSAKDSTTRLLKTPANCFFNNPPKFEFHAMDFNFYSGEVYFSDVKFLVKTIRRADLTNKSDNEVVVYGTGNVEGIGVDWVSSNLYWTDSTFNQVWVSRLDGSLQTALIDTENKPLDIALDPISKVMYWIEVGTNYTSAVIKRASLDGTGVSTFVSEDLKQPTGLAMDFHNTRLYWTDPEEGKIESIRFDGTMRREQTFYLKAKYRPYDIAVFQDFIAFTDKQLAANTSGLRVIEKASGKEVNDGILHAGAAGHTFGLVAFDKHNQPLVSENVAFSCNKDNGGCSQLCLPSPNGFKCACVNGMKLDDDGRSCRSAKEIINDFFLLADDYRHQVYKVSGDLQTLVAFDFPRLDRPIGLTYDPREEVLYWTDFDKGRIRRSNMDGSNVINVHAYRTGKPARIDALAFDYQSRLLYYADMLKNEIAVLNPNGVFRKVVVKDGMNQPRALKLLPERGLMYFGSKGKIERADMDGSNRVTIVDSIGTPTKKGWIAGLDIDIKEGLLYWCDHNAATIHVSQLDGSDARTIIKLQPNADPFAVALRSGRLYWTDWKLRGLWSTSVKEPVVQSDHNETFTGLNDILYFNVELLSGPNACTKDNGGCSHFCLPTSNGRTCACPDDGVQVVDTFDGFNCPGLSTCTSDIPNGQLERNCHKRFNATCKWRCNNGFGSVTSVTLRCGADLMWDQNLDLLCTDNTCPLLVTPENAEVDDACPYSAAFGAKCVHNCTEGYQAKEGDDLRVCQDNGQWSGRQLVCIEKPPSIIAGHVAANNMIPIIAGIIAAIIVAIIIALLLIFFLVRRKKKFHAGMYRENSNVQSESSTPTSGTAPSTHVQSAPSSATIPQPGLVMNAQAPVYDVATGSVVFNRDIAFENPGYATQDEMAAMGGNNNSQINGGYYQNQQQAGPLPEKKGDSDDEFDDLDLKAQSKLAAIEEITQRPGAGFRNPLYANGKVTKDDNPYESLPDLKK